MSWLGITARSVRFMEKQPDLPDRTLVLKLERLGERQTEQALMDEVARRRNAIWSELFDGLNAIVGYLRDHPEPVPVTFRMADFASFALKVAALWGRREELEKALAKLEAAQTKIVLETEPGHPIQRVLGLWLLTAANRGREMDAGTLHQELSELACEHQMVWPNGNGRVLSVAFAQARAALREEFDFETVWDAHAKQNRYSFGPNTLPLALTYPKPLLCLRYLATSWSLLGALTETAHPLRTLGRRSFTDSTCMQPPIASRARIYKVPTVG